MWYAGQLAEFYHEGSGYGFQNDKLEFNFETLVHNRTLYIKKLNQIYLDRIKKNNIKYIHGCGVFVNSHTIKVDDSCYTAEHIVIATGSEPVIPLIKGAEFAIDSNGFFDLKQLPKKIAVVGGGYIAVELASILNQLGSEIKYLLRKDMPLRKFDSMLSHALVDIMTLQGIQLLPDHEVIEILRDSKGQLTIHCKNKQKISLIDAVIFAIGRKPNTHSLNLKAANVQIDDNGFISTDKFEVTNISNIYAIGDVTGKKMLTPVAIAAGRRLAARIFGNEKDSFVDYINIPTVVFSHPPIATLGLTEKVATELYGKDQIIIYFTRFNPLFYALNDKKISSQMKLITLRESGKVIGCHLIGLNVDEMLQGFALAIKMGATKNDFDNMIVIHPTSAEELHFVKSE